MKCMDIELLTGFTCHATVLYSKFLGEGSTNSKLSKSNRKIKRGKKHWKGALIS